MCLPLCSLQWLQAEGFTYLDDFSTWDVFRSTIPLVHLLYSDTVTNMVQSLVVKAEQGGWLPIFPGEVLNSHCVGRVVIFLMISMVIWRTYVTQ